MAERTIYGKLQPVIPPPDQIEIQTKSYADFLQPDVPPAKREEHGLQAIFHEIFPVASFDGRYVLDFVKSFDTPNLRMCLDTGHAAVFGIGPGEVLRQVGKEYLACLHVHDNDGEGDRHWVPYTGVIDWADFSRALHEIGFGGALSLETNVSGKLPASVRFEWEKALASAARALTLKPQL